MTLERAQQFVSLVAARTARPALDANCSVSLETFDRLIAAYSFPQPDWVQCQLEHKGSKCKQEHGRGWIARRKDGKEGFIGHVCANHRFDADEKFKAETSRINRELRIDGLIARITARLEDPIFHGRLEGAIDRAVRLREAVARSRDRWPAELLNRLRDMVKTGNQSLRLDIRYVEKDENGRERHDWRAVQWRSVAAPGALDVGTVANVASRLNAAQAAMKEAVPSRDQPERALKGWLEKLDDLDNCEAELDEIRDALDAFERPENLRLLPWTVRRDSAQLETVRAALATVDGRAVTELEVAEVQRRWRQEISDAHGGRDFRVS